jgi:hypothetical protein
MRIPILPAAAFLLPLVACTQPFIEPQLSDEARRRPALEQVVSDPARTIAGTVVDTEGRPVVAQVLAVSGEESVSMDTGPDGQFRLMPPAAGELVVHAQTADGRTGMLREPRLGRLDHVVAVRIGATLRVTHDSPNRARIAVFHDNRRLIDAPTVIGRTDRWVVPPGAVRIVLYDAEDRVDERRIAVAAGDDVAVRLTLGG